MKVTDEMVTRFLGWKLPEDFHPDAGISFQPYFNVEWNAKHGKPPQRHEPIGTNLFTADQAKAMLEHVLAVAPSTVGASSEDAELIRLLHQRYQDSGDATARKAAWRLEELTQAPSSIGGKDGRCPTCLNALTPGAHALLTQIQDDRAILALIEEVEALRRGVGVTHGDGNDPAMLLKRVVGTREDVDRREAIYREAVAHGKGGWWRCYTCAPATADDNL